MFWTFIASIYFYVTYIRLSSIKTNNGIFGKTGDVENPGIPFTGLIIAFVPAECRGFDKYTLPIVLTNRVPRVPVVTSLVVLLEHSSTLLTIRKCPRRLCEQLSSSLLLVTIGYVFSSQH